MSKSPFYVKEHIFAAQIQQLYLTLQRIYMF